MVDEEERSSSAVSQSNYGGAQPGLGIFSLEAPRSQLPSATRRQGLGTRHDMNDFDEGVAKQWECEVLQGRNGSGRAPTPARSLGATMRSFDDGTRAEGGVTMQGRHAD